ncbi:MULTISPECIES: tryptophan--tRNA ligase [unclassified Mycoplasma]|uniref:tryptophan--tRNA ligase n=1 Tax=unclassified Mycoplasma TaxID=2683645 RepID=UPI00211BE004|nr:MULTISPECIES: tryptophan--tRNA ligase [unclassified Mycoplasma]UUM19680.1 tryptophan--tRNA ligase [Mycoplasma sp. 1578d]UUM24663.1 tryptophan--tRNA ligase [Mycoplasma sp. 3686d]
MKRLVSGIKPTGELTLGNYIGAIANFIKLQDEYESYFFVADMHALTTGTVDPIELEQARKSTVALYLACGLDPQKTIIFYQSSILEHTQMMWLCNSETTVGELERMTQFKDKAQKLVQGNGTMKIPSNLLMYPVLMASDILLYNPEIVPVGEDQVQHIELTRNIAERLNRKYNLDLNIPEGFIPQVGARVKSLTDPTSKMSKSDKSSKGTIYLLEDPEKAYKKILKAVTDSEGKVYISENKPGVLNLLTIYASLKDMTIQQAEAHFKDVDYKEFKEQVASVVKELLINIQEKYHKALKNVDQIAHQGRIKAQKIAKETVNKVQKHMGLYREINESK